MTRRIVRRALEAPIERRVANDALAVYGVKSVKLELRHDTSYPDRLFWIPGGRPLLVEMKKPGGDAETKQADTHDWLRALGYDVEVHDTYDGAIRAVIGACERARNGKV